MKLIRDKTALKQIDKNRSVLYLKDRTKINRALSAKLLEETNEAYTEIKNNGTKQDLTEEIADVLQVLDAICVHNDISHEDLMQIKHKKFDEKGGFENYAFMM